MDIMRTHYASDITPDMSGDTVTVAGWIHEMRDLGGIYFLILRDRGGFMQITMVKKKTDPELFESARRLIRESVLTVTGTVKSEDKAPRGYEIIPQTLSVLSESDSPLPMDITGKVNADIDTRLDSRFIDLRRRKTLDAFVIRHHALKAVRNFLENEGFIEIHTPKVVAAATEGGTALFPITYFNREAFLNQSPQLYKQIMMSAGFDKVYEIGAIFRAEEHDQHDADHVQRALVHAIDAHLFPKSAIPFPRHQRDVHHLRALAPLQFGRKTNIRVRFF